MIRLATIAMAASFLMFEAACTGAVSSDVDPEATFEPEATFDGGSLEDLADPAAAAEAALVGDGGLDIVATRTSGVAPLMVVFEGDLYPGVVSEVPFHELDYQWSFGDSASGAWSTTGAAKNEEYGPVAAHVFEQPGTYTVRLTVRDRAGNVTTGTVAITVQDPNVVFSGTKTVCFSPSRNFSGCPVGATQVATSSMSTVMTHLASGKRLLLHRGESFTGSGSINVAGPGIVGAYGTGAAPRIVLSGTTAKGFSVSGKTARIDDWRIMDLDIDGVGATTAYGVNAAGRVRNLLMLRLSVQNADSAFEFNTSTLKYLGHAPHDGVGIVDSRATRFNGRLNGAFLSGVHVALLGTTIDLNASGEHTVRANMMRASVIGHSIISNPAKDKSCLKLHAPTWTGNAATDYTERVVIRRTAFLGANNNWLVTPGPQNSTSNEHVRDVILDGNYFVAGTGTRVGLVIMAESITARNNVFDMTRGLAHNCVNISDRGAGPSPADVDLFHNVCYSGAGTVSLVDGADSWPNVSVSNNQVVAPGGASLGDASGADGLVGGNLRLTNGYFVVPSPSRVEDFAPSSASPVIDVGAPLDRPMRDLRGRLRADEANLDVSAFETN